MSRDKPLPEPWRSALEPKGVASIRGLATKADLSPMAASRLVKGQGTSAETVNAVAESLFDGDRNRVWELRGSSARDHGDWTLPAESSLLSEEQRAAIRAVIASMLPEELKRGGAGQPRHETVEVDSSKDEAEHWERIIREGLGAPKPQPPPSETTGLPDRKPGAVSQRRGSPRKAVGES